MRLFAVLRFESVIHEFDPYFNYRTTHYLVREGLYEFWNWYIDTHCQVILLIQHLNEKNTVVVIYNFVGYLTTILRSQDGRYDLRLCENESKNLTPNPVAR